MRYVVLATLEDGTLINYNYTERKEALKDYNELSGSNMKRTWKDGMKAVMVQLLKVQSATHFGKSSDYRRPKCPANSQRS